MARTLTSALQVARHLIESKDPWLLFVEVESKSRPGSFFRLVNNTRNIEADGKRWMATTMKIELPEESGEGTLGQLRIAIPNISRIPMAFVEGGEGEDDLIDQPVTVTLAYAANLDSVNFAGSPSWRHVITEAVCDEQTAVFVCGHPAGIRMAPGPTYDRVSYPQLLPSAGQGSVGAGY